MRTVSPETAISCPGDTAPSRPSMCQPVKRWVSLTGSSDGTTYGIPSYAVPLENSSPSDTKVTSYTSRSLRWGTMSTGPVTVNVSPAWRTSPPPLTSHPSNIWVWVSPVGVASLTVATVP